MNIMLEMITIVYAIKLRKAYQLLIICLIIYQKKKKTKIIFQISFFTFIIMNFGSLKRKEENQKEITKSKKIKNKFKKDLLISLYFLN